MEFKKEIKQIWKPLKDLDAEIRKAETEQDDLKENFYWVIEIGLYESLGERGLIYTLFYDDYPTENEIIKYVKDKLRDEKDKYTDNPTLSYYEEEYLKILNKLNI